MRLRVSVSLMGGLLALSLLVTAAPAAMGAERAQWLDAGPVLAGGEAVWAERRSAQEIVLKRSPGTVIHRFSVRRDPALRLRLTALQAGGDAVVAASEIEQRDVAVGSLHRVTGDVFAGAGPLTVLDRCSLPAGETQPPFSVDTDGGAVAWSVSYCDQAERRGVFLREGAGPVVRLAAAQASGVQMAGRFIAWVEEPRRPAAQLVVYDRAASAVVRRIAVPHIPEIAIQQDGTVAFIDPAGDNARVFVTVPARPAPVAAPLPRRNYTAIRLAGGRLVYATAGDGWFGQRVGLLSLADGTHRTLERGALGSTLDFDGRRIAWASGDCAGARVRVVDPNRVPHFGPPRLRCRLALLERPRVVGKRLRLRYRCSGITVADCRSWTTVRATHSRANPPAARGRLLLRGSTVGVGEHSGPQSRRLLRAGLRMLREAGRLQVVMTVSVRFDRRRVEVRRTQVTLRAPTSRER